MPLELGQRGCRVGAGVRAGLEAVPVMSQQGAGDPLAGRVGLGTDICNQFGNDPEGPLPPNPTPMLCRCLAHTIMPNNCFCLVI